MPPFLTDRTACPGLELLSCELLANPAAVADALVLNVYTKHRQELSKAWVKTLVGPLPSLWGCPTAHTAFGEPAALAFLA